MKTRVLRRDWSHAEAARGPCIVCGDPNTDLAHTYSRAIQDEKRVGPRGGVYLWVNPASVVSLCRAKSYRDGEEYVYAPGHHSRYDGRKLSILGLLSMAKLRNLIKHVGKHRARRRLSGGQA